MTSVAKDEAISKAVLGILRVQAIQELGLTNPVRYENILPFNLCDQLPGGDRILETLAEMSSSKVIDRTNKAKEGNNAYILCKLYFAGLTQFYVDKKTSLYRDIALDLGLGYGFTIGFDVWSNKSKE